MHRLLLTLFFSLSVAYADALPGWEGANASSTLKVDHGIWQDFLDQYLMRDDFGQTYFTYSKVSRAEKTRLKTYIRSLEQVDPLELTEAEQKAYWFNLYNAVTVQTILNEYPVKSIREIGGRFGGLIPTGPWKKEVVVVNGKNLSLDDIEHGIVRPKFQDYRVHYAFNCAAMGCPNLAAKAYTGDNIEALLNEAEIEFVNHQRGVRFQGGKLIISKIFDWYRADFVATEAELTEFLAQFAEPKLRAQLKAYKGKIKYEYDWSLNEVLENI